MGLSPSFSGALRIRLGEGGSRNVPNETQASVSARGKLAPSFGLKVVVLFLVSVDPATSF